MSNWLKRIISSVDSKRWTKWNKNKNQWDRNKIDIFSWLIRFHSIGLLCFWYTFIWIWFLTPSSRCLMICKQSNRHCSNVNDNTDAVHMLLMLCDSNWDWQVEYRKDCEKIPRNRSVFERVVFSVACQRWRRRLHHHRGNHTMEARVARILTSRLR